MNTIATFEVKAKAEESCRQLLMKTVKYST